MKKAILLCVCSAFVFGCASMHSAAKAPAPAAEKPAEQGKVKGDLKNLPDQLQKEVEKENNK